MAGEIIAQTVGAVFGNLRKSFAQFFVGKLPAFGKQFGEILQDLLDGLRRPSDRRPQSGLTAPVYLNIEQRLEVFDVLVVNAESVSRPLGGSSICFNL